MSVDPLWSAIAIAVAVDGIVGRCCRGAVKSRTREVEEVVEETEITEHQGRLKGKIEGSRSRRSPNIVSAGASGSRVGSDAFSITIRSLFEDDD